MICILYQTVKRVVGHLQVAGALVFEKPARAFAEEEEEEVAEDDGSQIIDLDGINGKKLAVRTSLSKSAFA
jgi:hypothetical protein